jgi:hypothetical protein
MLDLGFQSYRRDIALRRKRWRRYGENSIASFGRGRSGSCASDKPIAQVARELVGECLSTRPFSVKVSPYAADSLIKLPRSNKSATMRTTENALVSNYYGPKS